MESFIYIYIIAINILGFVIMGIDKSKAKHHVYRISEKTLFLISLIGGSLGSIIGMYVFHHKTKHWYFKFGLPLILIIQVITVYIINKQ